MSLPGFETWFPFFFVALWVAICAFLGRAGGWIRLAEAYGALGLDFRGRALRFRSGAFNWVSYNGVLFPFRAGHPPFSVPWSDVRFEAGRKMMMPTVAMTFARCPGVRLTVHRGLAEQLAEAGGVRDRIPAAGRAGPTGSTARHALRGRRRGSRSDPPMVVIGGFMALSRPDALAS